MRFFACVRPAIVVVSIGPGRRLGGDLQGEPPSGRFPLDCEFMVLFLAAELPVFPPWAIAQGGQGGSVRRTETGRRGLAQCFLDVTVLTDTTVLYCTWFSCFFLFGGFMRKRSKMGRSSSRRDFRNKAGVHPRNNANPMRGGIRL